MKEHKPVEIAEFSQSRNISDKPAFCWWVPYTLRKRDRIIDAANARVLRTTHKYGIEVPTSVYHLKRIDVYNGNRFLLDATDKEMANFTVSFEILDEGKPAPVGWKKASEYLVCDVKMDFTRKSRRVKDGHRTVDPEHSTFDGVFFAKECTYYTQLCRIEWFGCYGSWY